MQAVLSRLPRKPRQARKKVLGSFLFLFLPLLSFCLRRRSGELHRQPPCLNRRTQFPLVRRVNPRIQPLPLQARMTERTVFA
jgi:hypothetical protein